MPTVQPTRVAILGGGPSALSAAFHLTDDPERRKNLEVTIYQMGWRLGGKGATGRDRTRCDRIEEHGIHLFGNFYDNTFRTLKRAYDEVKWPKDDPISPTTMDTVFIPSNFQISTEWWDRSWHVLPGVLPNNETPPWEGDGVPDLETLLNECLELAYDILTSDIPPPPSNVPPGLWASLAHKAGDLVDDTGEKALTALLKVAHLRLKASPPSKPSLERHGFLFEALVAVKNALGKLAATSEHWRWVFLQFDVLTTTLVGLVEDGVFEDGIDVIDGEDFRDWLQRHGLSPITMQSSVVNAIAQTCMHWPHGRTDVYPRMSAAAYGTFFVRQFLADGASMYYFACCTGDTIVLPLYFALKQRGVRFAFFHKVEELVPTADGLGLHSVELQVQATTKGGEPYDPLVQLDSGQYAWPSKPHFDQLVEGERLKAEGVDLESWWTPWKGVGRKTLVRGVDFDTAVLAIPIPAHKHLAPRFLASGKVPIWKQASDNLASTATRMVQIWTKRSTKELGWDWNDNRVVGSGWIGPLPDFADFSDSLKYESWPEDGPKGLIYFIGGLQDPEVVPPFTDHDFPRRQKERVLWSAVESIRDLGSILPHGTRPDDPRSLDFDELYCPDESGAPKGEQRAVQQFVKANVDPNERYIQCAPGTMKYRPKAWGSGVDGLVFCGDWVWTGFNISSFEASVMGGMLASHAVCGSPKLDDILAYRFLHPEDRDDGPWAR